MGRLPLLCLALLSLIPNLAVAAPPTSAPSPDDVMAELKTRFDVGDYRGVLGVTARTLALGGKAAEGIDKHAISTMRAEALLRLKETDAAALTFHQTAKLTDDPEKSNADLVTEILVRRSKSLQYTPKALPGSPKPTPISIVEPDQRKLAMRALFADEWAIVAPKLKAAKEGASLPPIATAVKAIQAEQVDLLDLVANGNDDQTKQAVDALREHSAELIGKALEKLEKHEQEVIAFANEVVHQQVMSNGPYGRQTNDLPRRRGLSGDDIKQLQEISRDGTQIGVAAQELVGGLGDKTAASDLLDQVKIVVQRADKALRADYSHLE